MKVFNNETYIATWEQSKWLVLSSFLFMIPSIYAYLHNLYFYSVLLSTTSIVSANYWRKALANSWRRNMDLALAKVSFIIFLSNGIIYVKKIEYIITGYSGLVILVYCYLLAGNLWKAKQSSWYIFHVFFHFIIMYEQLIIIHSMLLYRKIK
jgi:hypothetical protein